MASVRDVAGEVGVLQACVALEVPRASYYRWLAPIHGPAPRRSSPRELGPEERQAVLGELHESRFVDQAPAEVYATLLDEGRYLCSERTMYRILAANQEVRERRAQLRHPSYAAPELLATKPNQLWSWDITKLLGPTKWTYFYLYVILDVFSRYVVGWMIAHVESAALAGKLIRETCERQNIEPGQLTIHADRGSSMNSKTVAFLLADLGVTKTHSRPHVSNDNPYSEAHFKTMKYRPAFPERFGSIEDARATSGRFFDWYATEHHHSGLGLHTPHDVHYGLAHGRRAARTLVLAAAQQAHPERFVAGTPIPPLLPEAAWINKPTVGATTPLAQPAQGVRAQPGAAEASVRLGPQATESALEIVPPSKPMDEETSGPMRH
jgi:putative transposase